MSRVLCVALAWGWFGIDSIQAHQPDTSYLTLRIGASGIDAAFAGDMTTLQKLFPDLDADQDRSISRDEGDSSRPVVEKYLREHLFLHVDGQEATWGDPRPLQWPTPDLSPIPEADWHQLLLQYCFHLPRETLPSAVQVTCDAFNELGLTHKIKGEFLVQDRVQHPVHLTWEEPKYRFDVRHALAKAPTGAPPQPTLKGTCHLLRRGIQASSRPEPLLLLLGLLVFAPFRRSGAIVAAFALGQLAIAVPVTLRGSPLALQWIELSQALAVMLSAAINLHLNVPRSTPPKQLTLGLSLAMGMIQGFASGGTSRESCLFPMQPLQCLGGFQAGTGIGLVCAALGIAGILALARKFHEKRGEGCC